MSGVPQGPRGHKLFSAPAALPSPLSVHPAGGWGGSAIRIPASPAEWNILIPTSLRPMSGKSSEQMTKITGSKQRLLSHLVR